jgi:hypothetical protein
MIKSWQIFNESTSNELTKEQSQEIIYYFSEMSEPTQKIVNDFYSLRGFDDNHFSFFEISYEEMIQYTRDLQQRCKGNEELTNKMIEIYEEIREERKIFPEAHEIESIFSDLHSLSIENFMSLWEFLSKGFFLHLDVEHYRLSQVIRCDLIKYYLVNTIKQKNKEKTKEFFSLYSYEINQNFKLFNNLIITYDKQLKSKLILSRKVDLIEFFKQVEQKLLYINDVFKAIIDNNIKKTLQDKILVFRKLNVENINKYL